MWLELVCCAYMAAVLLYFLLYADSKSIETTDMRNN